MGAEAAETAEPSPYPGTEEVRAEFEAVCRRLTEGENPYFGRRALEEARQRLEAGAGDAASELELRSRLVYELTRLGRLREAKVVARESLDLIEREEFDGKQEARRAFTAQLAMAAFQAAEDANCLANHRATSCIVPFTAEALHVERGDTRAAGDLYARLAEREPAEVRWRWLLNLSRMLSADYPEGVPSSQRLPDDALSSATTFSGWRDIASSVGVAAFDLAGGAVMDDFDGDGYLDLVSSTMDPCGGMKAFRNEGDGTFTDVSAAWGLDAQLGSLNIVHADYDDDGMLDILVLRGGWLGEDGRIRNSLLRNDLKGRTGRFVDVTAAAGIAFPAYPTQTAAWGDYDGDGDLDLYIGNESQQTDTTDPSALYAIGSNAYPSQLLRNDGEGTFTDVTRAAGVANLRMAKGVAWGDFDDDGDPDLYVSNIGPNRLYRNDGDGTFTDVAQELGVTGPERSSFATWFFDHDNDGDLDLFVAAYQAPIDQVLAAYVGKPASRAFAPVLYRNDGGRFTDVSEAVGFDRPLLPMGANYGDLDSDGWPDVALGTGTPDFAAVMPNVLYRNDGGRFLDVTFASGFGSLQKGHGVAFGDLDHDGDQDLFQQLGGAFPYDEYFNALYENPGNGARWITLLLEGRAANRAGIGARISVAVRRGEERRTLHSLAGSGGSFGGSSLRQEIGLGDAQAIDSVTILWPGSGTRDEYRDIPLDRAWRAVEGAEALEPVDLPRFRLSGARESSGSHTHRGEQP